MRRAYSIVVVLAMLAMPLALLPPASGDAPMCNGMCCRRPAGHAKAGEDPMGMQCTRGPLGHVLDCTMQANDGMNCRIATLLAPTILESAPALPAPGAARRRIISQASASLIGVTLIPFLPPRA